MDNPGLPSDLWNTLDGRLWHATCPTGLAGVIRDQEIRVFHESYKGSFCKMLCGVSLMDFGPSATDRDAHFGNWSNWFGHAQNCRVPIWIEIDRDAVRPNLLDAEAAHVLWGQGNHSRQIIPGVEACHKGPIPAAALTSILCIDCHEWATFEVFPIAAALTCVSAFAARLPPPPPENELVEAVRQGREQAEATRRASRLSSEGTGP